MTLRRGRERKERFVLPPKLHLSRILRQGPSSLFPRHASGSQLCLFPGSLGGCLFSSSQRPGKGRAACRGLWTKGSVGLGRGQLVSTPRAYQLPPSLLEAVPSIQQTLRKCWLSRGIQDLRRVGELVGSASRSREDARGAEKTPLRAARQAVWVLGSWSSAEDRLKHREPKLISA